uniref:Uncharacterized protein n=1 Tax=Clastoptera arizonana TaxID=38151 RepID=A0A1B6DNG9_9HEMI
MSTGSENFKASVINKITLKPLNKHNFLFFYTPIYGVCNYGMLSVNVMNPGLAFRIFPRRDVTNFLLLGSVVGTGLYISNTALVKSASTQKQFLYSGYGSLLFTFGSVLLWAVLRSVLPENKNVNTIIGIASGISLVAFGKEFLDFADSKVIVKK